MWVKLDDHVMGHPKIQTLSDKAFRTWVGCLVYAGLHETDGWIPLRQLRHERRELAELVRAGLLERQGPEGFQIHDWSDYQPSRAEVIKRREQGKERWRRWREAHPDI